MTDQIIQVAALALISGLTWIARRAIKAFEKKTKIDVDQATENLIESLIEKGVRYVEEKYARKGNTGGTSSIQKHAEVQSFVVDELKKRGLNAENDNIAMRIDAAVNKIYHPNELKSGQ